MLRVWMAPELGSTVKLPLAVPPSSNVTFCSTYSMSAARAAVVPASKPIAVTAARPARESGIDHVVFITISFRPTLVDRPWVLPTALGSRQSAQSKFCATHKTLRNQHLTSLYQRELRGV